MCRFTAPMVYSCLKQPFPPTSGPTTSRSVDLVTYDFRRRIDFFPIPIWGENPMNRGLFFGVFRIFSQEYFSGVQKKFPFFGINPNLLKAQLIEILRYGLNYFFLEFMVNLPVVRLSPKA
jgi:hypothetical protein